MDKLLGLTELVHGYRMRPNWIVSDHDDERIARYAACTVEEVRYNAEETHCCGVDPESLLQLLREPLRRPLVSSRRRDDPPSLNGSSWSHASTVPDWSTSFLKGWANGISASR